MPFIALALVIFDAVLIVHAAYTGRFMPWGPIILLVPGAGGLAYIIMELIPTWFGSYQGQQAKKSIGRALNPGKQYNQLRDQVEIADTVATRTALAEECLSLQLFEEAEIQYDAILAKPHGEDPRNMIGKGRALFGGGKFNETVALLDELKRKWPDFESAEGHLLYARALDEAGRTEEAADEYRAVSTYYSGAEPRARHGIALKKLGRNAEANAVLSDVVRQLRLAPRHVRRMQAPWLDMAQRALNSP